MPNHPDFPDDFGSYEDDLPLDDPSSGLEYKYVTTGGSAGDRENADLPYSALLARGVHKMTEQQNGRFRWSMDTPAATPDVSDQLGPNVAFSC